MIVRTSFLLPTPLAALCTGGTATAGAMELLKVPLAHSCGQDSSRMKAFSPYSVSNRHLGGENGDGWW